MTTDEVKSALIVGAGPGLSAAVARKLSSAGWRVALAARDVGKLAAAAAEIGGEAFACDASNQLLAPSAMPNQVGQAMTAHHHRSSVTTRDLPSSVSLSS